MMTKKEQTAFSNRVKKIAKSCYKAGWTVEINRYIPYVAIENKKTGDEYFFQGDTADELLEEHPDWLDVTDEDYLVYIAQDW